MDYEEIIRIFVPVIGAGIWFLVNKIWKVEINKKLLQEALSIILTIIIEAEDLQENNGKQSYMLTQVEHRLSRKHLRQIRKVYGSIAIAIKSVRRVNKI